LNHVQNYRRERQIRERRLNKSELDRLLLVDYVIFRYKIINRKPNFEKGSTLDKASSIVESLAKDARYLDETLQEIWRDRISQISYRDMQFGFRTWRKLSPQTRSLLQVAYSWDLLRQEVHQTLSVGEPPIEAAIVLYAIYSELQTTTQTVLLSNELSSQLVDLSWVTNLDTTKEKRICFLGDQGQETLRTTYNISTLQEALLVLRYFKDKSLPFTTQLKTISPLTLLMLLNSFGLESYSESGNELLLKLRSHRQLNYHAIYTLTRTIDEIESNLGAALSLENIPEGLSLIAQNQDNLSSIFKLLRTLARGYRRHAELTMYDLSTNQGLVIRRRFYLPKEYEFTVPKVHTVGELRKVTKRRRVQVDIIKIERKEILATVLSKSRWFNTLLPVQTGISAKFIYFLRKYPLYASGGLHTIFIVASIVAVFFTNDRINLSSFLMLILLSPAWEFLLGFLLSSILPERSQDIG
jgi:hypothetical protein